MHPVDEAIVLAGGLGTRLRSVVADLPKPLAPVCGRPFITYLLDLLAGQGMRRAVLATGYLGERVEAALGASWQGMELVYSVEPQPLGTGGAIALALRHIHGAACFVLNGDSYLKLDYAAFDARTRRLDAALGIALAEVTDVARYGAVEVDNERVRTFAEKGRHGPGYINAGVYRIERGLLDDFIAGSRFSFEAEVMQPMAGRQTIAAFTDTRDFIDIGVPEDYARVQHMLRERASIP
jgi:D-glycero-alpha-D-manno-heptose 1-phosphate guanylyltransferase